MYDVVVRSSADARALFMWWFVCGVYDLCVRVIKSVDIEGWFSVSDGSAIHRAVLFVSDSYVSVS